MAMTRVKGLVAAAACAVSLIACGEPAVTPSAATDGMQSLTFRLSIADDNRVLRVRIGDEVVPRLPLAGHGDPGWVVRVPPNPAVLAGGDDLRFFPSEPDRGRAPYQEFSFIAVGEGRTTFTLTHGYQEFRLTVQVAGPR